MNRKQKAVMFVGLIYLLAPLDLIPGCLIDDIAVLVLSYMISEKQI